MNVRRLSILVVVLAFLTVPAWTSDEEDSSLVKYIGTYFDCQVPTCFCARVSDGGGSVVGAPLYFEGFNLWGQRYRAGYDLLEGPLVRTGGLGIGCAWETWPPNVYKVRAITEEGESFPSAVTIFSRYWCGVFAGGKLSLDTFIRSNGVSLQEFRVPRRNATVGFIYQIPCNSFNNHDSSTPRALYTIQLPPGLRNQLLLVDPEGPTCIASTNFSVWAVLGRREIKGLIVRGYCKFSQGDLESTCQFPFELTLKRAKDDERIVLDANNVQKDGVIFHIKVYNYLHCLIYEACDEIKCGGAKVNGLPRPGG